MAKVTTIIFSILIILALVFLFILPKYQEFQDLTFQVREKKAELAFKEKYFKELRETAKELEEYDEEIVKIDSAIPIRPFLPNLFLFLSETASRSGLILKQIDDFSIKPSEQNPDLKEVIINASFIGSYEGMKKFLSILENSTRIIGVDNISFSEPREESKNIFEFSLELKTHSY